MNLNPVEWTRAQELLLKLVKAVGPFANKPTVPSSPLEGAFSQARQFFLAPPLEPSVFRNETRLLTALNEAKKAVDGWIGELPENQAKTSSQTVRKGRDLLPPNKGMEGEGGAGRKTGASRSAPLTVPEAPPPQVASQAQKLVEQVRQAILTLSRSSYLNDPKAGPLRDALKRLKPLIDQLIEAVSQDGMHSAGDGLPPLVRYKAPSEREAAVLKKLVPFPKERSSAAADPKREGDSLSPKDKENLLKETVDAGHLIGTPQENRDRGPSERTSLSAAPYLSQSPSSSRKTKKKRKGFWLRDEEEERNNP